MPLKILLADDSMTAQKTAQQILAQAGHEVISCSNGAVAAKKLAEKPDMLILDVFMPGYTGIELCEKIRNTPGSEKTPVLLTVGKVEPYDPREGQRVKADGVIIKPFEASDLLAAVQKIAEQLAPPKPPEPAYEKTMIFQSPVVKEFQDQSYQDWKEETATFDTPPVLQAPSRNIELPKEMASAPAFGIDEPEAAAPVSAAATPAPTSFDETVNYPPKMAPSPTAPTAEFTMPLTPVETNQMEALIAPPPAAMEASAAPAMAMEFAAAAPAIEATPVSAMPMVQPEEHPVVAPEPEHVPEAVAEAAPQPELMHTAAAAVPESAVSAGSALDKVAEEAPSYAISAQDPALETDRTRMAIDYATKFGTPEPAVSAEPAETTAAASAEPSAMTDEDFEARVAAAMAKYGDVPSAEVAAEAAPEAAHRRTSSVEFKREPSPSSANVKFSAPEPVVEPTRAPEASAAPSLDDTQKIEVPPGATDERHIDETISAAAPEIVVDAAPVPEALPVPEPASAAQQPPAGMQDAALVEQMQAAFKDLPVDNAPHEPAPAAPPAPVVEAAPAAPAAASANAPDVELANALAAAVGGHPVEQSPVTVAANAAENLDAHHATTAVHNVLRKMLPTIMMEVAKEMEAVKKKTNF